MSIHITAPGAVMKNTTTVIASASLALPVWWPTLADISVTAGLWMPILGVIWLAVQIYRALVGKPKK